ncbi:MAG TPA: SWIM zinc finger domain-containing protein [Accumulibacter sp.]|uniref:SWIM zinc finger family protein n=1 Tax=Accumulibacter sp. TaxID=2053492 RepID=UPI002BC5E8CF|nr:SWIM zinc finger family protein [Accumulibacter sp.]HMW81855.1 SWIM zinc finger domain-containing protein [Accumulibacter sp.]
MAASALEFTYRYPWASAVVATPQARTLQLATSSRGDEHPYFFHGRIEQPRSVADMLLALLDVVRTHYFLPRPPQMDPVVTSNDAMLRFEGFSGCCGVYVRVDLATAGLAAERHGRGTTNVDFNMPMRAALMRLQERERVEFSVGRAAFALSRGDERVVEKKVRLPLRWLKGFSEVQAYLPRLVLRAEVDGGEARRFARSLPLTSVPRQPSFVISSGAALRLSQRPAEGAVAISGVHRLRTLPGLVQRAERLRIWSDALSGVSAWEVVFAVGRVTLLVSPETQRGFSGEGQVLSSLASAAWQKALPRVRAQLHWQNEIDVGEVARATELSAGEVEAALAALGARGLAGYDCSTGRYFHRELPFDLERVEAMQPRLLDARQLLADNRVRRLPGSGDGEDFAVDGSDVVHHVRLRADSDRCSCPWFSKQQGERGPCKHILAARLLRDGEADTDVAAPA